MMGQALTSDRVLRSSTKPNNKRALGQQLTSDRQQQRRRRLPILEGGAWENGSGVGGILKVKAKHKDLIQGKLPRPWRLRL